MEDRIKLVLSRVLNINSAEISDDFSKDSTEKWDSMMQMTLVIALEEEFSIEFNDEQISQLISFKLIHLVLKEVVNQ